MNDNITTIHGFDQSLKDFAAFKVDQLKEMIKFLRTHAGRRDLALSGNKSDLVARLSVAFFQPPVQTSSSSTASSSNTSPSTSSKTTPQPKPSSSSKSKITNMSPLNSLNLQVMRKEENTLMELFKHDMSIGGRIDPHQHGERFLYIKVFKNENANFSMDFTLSQEEFTKLTPTENYQIHIHYFSHEMKPKNWSTEYSIIMNGIHKLEPPAINRKIAKGIKKEVLIVSTPFVVKRHQIVSGNNRLEIRAGPYSMLDGRLFVIFTKILTTEQLVQIIESRVPTKHNLDLGDNLETPTNDNSLKYIQITPTKSDNLAIPQPEETTSSTLTDSEKSSINSILKAIQHETPIDKMDDVIEEIGGGDEIVPLKDPLSLCRIEIPAKGKYCVHKSCFDLAGYLDFGKTSKTYNCPRCDKPLPFSELIIDRHMQKILNEVGDNVEKVLVKDDGSFTICEDAPKKKISNVAIANIAQVIAEIDEEEGSKSPPFLSFGTSSVASSPPFSSTPPSHGLSSNNNTSTNSSLNSNRLSTGFTIDDAIEID